MKVEKDSFLYQYSKFFDFKNFEDISVLWKLCQIGSVKTPLTFSSLNVLTLKNFTISSYFESFEFSDFEKFTSLRTLKTFEKIH